MSSGGEELSAHTAMQSAPLRPPVQWHCRPRASDWTLHTLVMLSHTKVLMISSAQCGSLRTLLLLLLLPDSHCHLPQAAVLWRPPDNWTGTHCSRLLLLLPPGRPLLQLCACGCPRQCPFTKLLNNRDAGNCSVAAAMTLGYLAR